MSRDYGVRAYKEGDEEKIVELLTKVFQGWPHIDTTLSPVDYWKWKYLENPIHRSYVSVGVNGDRIISCQHNRVLKIKVKDKTIYGISGQDLAVHPDYRGLGLSSDTVKHANQSAKEDGVIYSYFLTRNPLIMKRCETSENPENRRAPFPFQLVNLTWIQDLDKHLKYFPMKNPLLMKLGANILRKWNIVMNQPSINSELEVEEVKRFDNSINRFLESIKDDYNYMVSRDADYLNWKYAYPDIGNFKKITIKEDERIIGFTILRANRYKQEYPIGYIVDLLTEKNRTDASSRLIAKAVDYFKEENVNIINSLNVRGHPNSDILSGFGFLNSRIKINMYIPLKEKHPAAEILSNPKIKPETVHVAWGDFDVLPVRTQYYQ